MSYAKTVSDSAPTKPNAISGIDATLAADGTAVSGIDATMADMRTTGGGSNEVARVTAATNGNVRTTVLPRVETDAAGPALVTAPRPRFEKVRPLGEGGVGEVTLVHDHDIRREVAVKRLHPQFNDAVSLVRFAEEVRTIGSLEHPNIVPVHDVGVDEEGQHYFVMKYVRGDTLEHIIEKLAAGDPKYVAKYPYDQRVEIFRGVLRAMQYAHAQGIVHRDIKPANVMVGPYGEIVLMDWGLAKKIRAAEGEVDPASLGPDAPPRAPKDDGDERAKLFRTRHGALLGTPAYMSPEQARGQNDTLDERSDVYSLCVMFYELLTLKHYLADQQTVSAMITAVAGFDADNYPYTSQSAATGVPAELMHLVRHGMANDPAKRHASVSAILDRLQEIGEGKIAVECPVTLMKRAGRESLNFVDRHPFFSMGAMSVGALGTVAALVMGVLHFVH